MPPVEIINGVRVNRRDANRYAGSGVHTRARTIDTTDGAVRYTQADIDVTAEGARSDERASILARVDSLADADDVPAEVVEAVRHVIETQGDQIAEATERFAAVLAELANADALDGFAELTGDDDPDGSTADDDADDPQNAEQTAQTPTPRPRSRRK
jgi:hypothetical protein